MLKSLRISNYRAFRELRMDELSRINLISGRNNSGKTTLLESILMLSSGHPEITLHTSIIRGMTSERLPPSAIPLIYWRQMFSSLDFGTPIEISAEHQSSGSLNMKVEMEHNEIVKTSLTTSNEVLLGDELQDPSLLVTIRRGDNPPWHRRIQVTDKEIRMERRNQPVLFPSYICTSRSRRPETGRRVSRGPEETEGGAPRGERAADHRSRSDQSRSHLSNRLADDLGRHGLVRACSTADRGRRHGARSTVGDVHGTRSGWRTACGRNREWHSSLHCCRSVALHPGWRSGVGRTGVRHNTQLRVHASGAVA